MDMGASLNLSANRNKLTELASGSKDDKANNWFVGHPNRLYLRL